MRALSLTGRLKACVTVRDWQWWQLPVLPRCYVAAVPVLAIAVIASDAARTDWRASDLVKFAVLLCCITISVISTPRLMYASAGMTPDLTGTWIVPAAILLPPVYAALLPVPMVALIWWFLHRGVPHRTVFTAAAISLEFGFISWVFRAFPASFAGATVGTGWHALTWVFAVMVSYLLGRELEHFLVVVAVKLYRSERANPGYPVDRPATAGAVRRGQRRRIADADHGPPPAAHLHSLAFGLAHGPVPCLSAAYGPVACRR